MLTIPTLQENFKLLSNEIKSIIQNQMNTMLDNVIDSVYTAQCEYDSSNSPDFWRENEELLDIANEYIHAILNDKER